MMMTRNLSEMMSASNNGAKTFNYEEAESIIKDKINLMKQIAPSRSFNNK